MEDLVPDSVLQSETLKYLYLLFSDDKVVPLSGVCFVISNSLILVVLNKSFQNTSLIPRYGSPSSVRNYLI